MMLFWVGGLQAIGVSGKQKQFCANNKTSDFLRSPLSLTEKSDESASQYFVQFSEEIVGSIPFLECERLVR